MRCGKSLSLTDVYIERLQSLFHMRNRIVYYVRKRTTINVQQNLGVGVGFDPELPRVPHFYAFSRQ